MFDCKTVTGMSEESFHKYVQKITHLWFQNLDQYQKDLQPIKPKTQIQKEEEKKEKEPYYIILCNSPGNYIHISNQIPMPLESARKKCTILNKMYPGFKHFPGVATKEEYKRAKDIITELTEKDWL